MLQIKNKKTINSFIEERGKNMKEEKLNLVTEWDKTFKLSDKVNHKKITFHTRFGFTLVADQYEPKNYEGKLPAISVCGPIF